MTEEEFKEFIDWAIDEAERYGYRKAVEDRPQGEWIRTTLTDCGSPIDECSNCGHHINGDVKVRNYCPNCGWRMKGADSERFNQERGCNKCNKTK